MKKSIIFLTLLLMGVLISTAQNTSDPYDLMSVLDKSVKIPQSPEVAAFEKYGETPVNLYSGTPNISIPIYTLQGNEISLPISLTYDASGIKVDQIATNVGLGWNLNFGGVVSRQVNHLPDQLSSGSGYQTISDPNFQGWQDYFYTSGTTQSLTGYHDSSRANSLIQLYRRYHQGLENDNELDTQADIFSFNVNGLSGTIIIDYTKTEPGTSNPLAYCFENPDIKVQVSASMTNNSTSSEIENWSIIDTNGTKYFFETPEYTWNEYSSDANEFIREYVSAWYLTEVVSVNGLDTFILDYSSPQFWGVDVDRAEKKRVYSSSINNCINNTFITHPQVVTHNVYKIKQFHLEGIGYKRADDPNNPVELLSVQTSGRVDLPGQKRYTQLTFKDENGLVTQKVNFNNNDYFKADANQTNNNDNTRLKLNGVSFWRDDLTDAKKYNFTYHNQNNVPRRDCNAIDYWGYYTNGSCSGDLTAKSLDPNWPVTAGRNRNPNFNKAINGSLQFISYPTGGRTEFVYEQHSGLSNTTNTVNGIVGGLRIKKAVDYEDNSTPVKTKYYFYNDLKEKLDDGTYTLSSITPSLLDSNYESSALAQQPLIFWETKYSYIPPGDGSNECNPPKYYQYATNLSAPAPQHITYDAVTEIIFRGSDLEGATVTEFYNDDYVGSPFPWEPNINRAVLNGEVASVKVYTPTSSNLKLLEETTNQYSKIQITNPEYSSYNGIYIYDPRTVTGTKGCLISQSINGDPDHKNVFFQDQVYTCLGIPPSCAWGCPNQTSQNYESYITYGVNKYNFKQQWKKLESTTKKIYEGNLILTDITNYSYSSLPEHYLVTNVATTDSKGLINETQIFYPHDVIGLNLYNSTEENIFSSMIDRNQIAEPLLVKKRYDNALTSTQKKHYSIFNNDDPNETPIIRTSSIEIAKGQDDVGVRRIISSYDKYGNPTIVLRPDGSKTRYLWGYYGKNLIAQIQNYQEGFTSVNFYEIISASDNDIHTLTGTENTLRQKLQLIRDQYDKSLVISYTYDPGIGVTSITDPRGNRTVFNYDQQNRLKVVKDADNNILSKNEYSYRINN